VAVYDNANWPELKDLKTALKAKVLTPAAATVNVGLFSSNLRPQTKE